MSTARRPLLLVEDDPNDVLFFQKALGRGEDQVPLEVARDAQEALDYLQGTGRYADRERYPRPALMVLDLKLPKESGMHVLEWLRSSAEFRELPVLILTSSHETRDVARARKLGVLAYEVKPVTFAALQGVVDSIRARWRAITLASEPR